MIDGRSESDWVEQSAERSDAYVESPGDAEAAAMDSGIIEASHIDQIGRDPDAIRTRQSDAAVASGSLAARDIPHQVLPIGEGEERDMQADKVVTDPEQVKAEIAQSDALMVGVASREAERLQRLLDNTKLDDLETRQALSSAIDRLKLTSDYHEASVPGNPEAARPFDILDEPYGSRIDGSPDLETARPFVSVGERQLEVPYDALERAADFRYALTVESRMLGEPVRRAAMDKTPTSIGKKPVVVPWLERDPEVPGYVYNLAATFTPEEGRPSLTKVSCAFAPEKTGRMQTMDGMNIEHPFYTPLTVSAQFDGVDMTGLELFWRHAAIDKSGDKRFGPVWGQLAQEGNGKLLAGLARRVDRDGVGYRGHIGLSFGNHPDLQIRSIGALEEKQREAGRFQRLLSGYGSSSYHHPLQFNYDAAQHAYLAPGAGGKTQAIDAGGVMGLVRDMVRFFPVMR